MNIGSKSIENKLERNPSPITMVHKLSSTRNPIGIQKIEFLMYRNNNDIRPILIESHADTIEYSI